MAMSALGKSWCAICAGPACSFCHCDALLLAGDVHVCGLDGTARLAQGTIDTYFAQNNLADFWVSVPSADRDTLERIRSHQRVSDVCARATAEWKATCLASPR